MEISKEQLNQVITAAVEDALKRAQSLPRPGAEKDHALKWVKFNESFLSNLKPPADGGRQRYRALNIPGVALNVGQGTTIFLITNDGKKFIKYGTYPEVSLEEVKRVAEFIARARNRTLYPKRPNAAKIHMVQIVSDLRAFKLSSPFGLYGEAESSLLLRHGKNLMWLFQGIGKGGALGRYNIAPASEMNYTDARTIADIVKEFCDQTVLPKKEAALEIRKQIDALVQQVRHGK